MISMPTRELNKLVKMCVLSTREPRRYAIANFFVTA